MSATQPSPFEQTLQRVQQLMYNLRDSASSGHHSQDFVLIRSEYLRVRTMFVSAAFALLALAWIAVDYVLLPSELFVSTAISRVPMAVGLLLVRSWAARSQNHPIQVRIAWFTLLMIPNLFYLAVALSTDCHVVTQAGYGFAPLLLTAFLGVFPFTLLESLSAGVLMLLTQAVVNYGSGQLEHLEGWQTLWLMSTVMLVSLWANHSQVSMLLRLYRQASLDPLTQLFNRRHLQARIRAITTRRQKMRTVGQSLEPVSLLMIDLDFFKRINDTYGHAVGDRVLTTFAQNLRKHLGPKDVGARYGGEEFCAVLVGSSLDEALQLAERIRLECHKNDIQLPDGEKLNYTISVGVTPLRFEEDIDVAFQRADKLLYQAKHNGRDRIQGGT